MFCLLKSMLATRRSPDLAASQGHRLSGQALSGIKIGVNFYRRRQAVVIADDGDDALLARGGTVRQLATSGENKLITLCFADLHAGRRYVEIILDVQSHGFERINELIQQWNTNDLPSWTNVTRTTKQTELLRM
jgi:hypothetical protein